jgi:MFS transporter, DHA1 family, multidrug resistance protein
VRALLADRTVVTVIALSFVMMFGFGVVVPVLPLFARSFGVDYAGAGLIISSFGLARLVADVFAGPIIDRVGERPAGAGGLALLSLGALMTGMAPNYPAAVVAWGAGGVGSAVVFAAQYSYLLKSVPRHRMARTLGIFYGAFNVGIVAGGFTGGIVARVFDLAAPLFLYSMISAGAAVLYWWSLRRPRPAEPSAEPEPESERAPWVRHAGGVVAELLRVPGFATAVLLNFAYMWMVAAIFDTLVPLFGHDELGMTTTAIGGVFAVATATEFFVLYPVGGLADRFGRKAVLIPSLAGLALSGAALGWSSSVTSFAIMLAVFGIFSGAAGVPPAAVLSDVVPEARSGTAVGTFRFAGDLSFLFAPFATGLVVGTIGFRAGFLLAVLPSVIALGFVLRTEETLRHDESA